MHDLSKKGHRGFSAVVLLVGGGAVAVAAWIGGHPGVAAVVLGSYLVLAIVAFIWSGGKGDLAAILRAGGDERQRGIDLRAAAAAGSVTAVFAVVGAVINIARTGGDPGAYGIVCLVFGIAYGVSLALFRAKS